MNHQKSSRTKGKVGIRGRSCAAASLALPRSNLTRTWPPNQPQTSPKT